MRGGWIPHDEGVIGQSAERVLLGELPHRDFVELYTGGLSFLHSLAFRLGGIDLLVPRLVLFGAALLWLPCVYWIARRFVPPLGAAGVTFAAVAWSLPHYFAALPSWYNLFFATFTAAALLRFVESRNRLYLAAAGAAAALSIMAKISGLFAAAACLLFLAYLEADERAEGAAVAPGVARYVYPVASIAALLGFLLVLWSTLQPHAGADVLFHFFLPALLVCAGIAWTELSAAHGPPAPRLLRLLRNVAAFAIGLALPLALFAFPFAAEGALPALIDGIFVLPSQRLSQAAWPPPPVLLAVPLLAVAIVLLGGIQRLAVTWALAVAALLFLLSRIDVVYLGVILAVQSSVPLVTAAGIMVIRTRRQDASVPSLQGRQAAALVCLLALCTLIQFPYAHRIYFLYLAPLLLLTAAALGSLLARPQRAPLIGLLVFMIAFGTTWMNHRFPAGLGYHYARGEHSTVLELPRGGGLRVHRAEAATYARLVQLLQAHSGNGYTLAAPDAPEVYFLSGLRNPTPHLFEFFGGADVERGLLGVIDSLGITVVAVNPGAGFSRPLSTDFMMQLRARFTDAEMVGPFLVAWRR